MDSNFNAHKVLKYMKIFVPIVAIGLVLTVVTFGITIATLVRVNKGFDQIPPNSVTTTISSTITTTIQTNTSTTTTNPTTTTTTNPTTTITNTTATNTDPAATTTNPTTATTTNPTTTQSIFNATLTTSIHIEDVMNHLNELQRIANASDATRAIDTAGFNETLNYIIRTLNANTNYNITLSFFPVRQFVLVRDPVFISSIDGIIQNHTYSINLSVTEFTVAQFSTSTTFLDYVELTVIPDFGCTDDDWLAASPPPVDRVALVIRGSCNFAVKAELASKYNVTALLIYNNGQSNDIPTLFLSYTLGQQLADAVLNSTATVSIFININVRNDSPVPIGNICADTPTGDATQTIVIGSHSDSVPAGPGINDNGSGSAANLELAVALARLFQTSSYEKYKYRVRFCWWGAEEVGLIGSAYHVRQAKNSTIIGERLADYLINLNYDMLGSPNFMFGIYDGKTATPTTPVTALAGSNKITALFQSWFEQQNLPWNYTDFSGRSDYGPFLAEGIVAGGLFSGADGTKSQAERDYYEQMLGQGMGGIAGATHDPCYHQACDNINNIDEFALEKMIQAAAYLLEYLARQDDLKEWLYPNGTLTRIESQEQRQEYDSINEYFGLPYL